MREKIKKLNSKKSLLLIILFGFLLRFYGINWDQGHALHPDERMIIMVTERLKLPTLSNLSLVFTPQSPLNPKFFAYGSLPLYLLRFFSWGVAAFFGSEWTSYGRLFLIGRFLSILFDLGTIFLIFKIAKPIWKKKIALLASFLYATAVFSIKTSQFYAVDIVLTFFCLFTIYRLLVFYEKPDLVNAIWAGVGFGLSLATKVSATVLLAGIGFSFIVDLLLLYTKVLRNKNLNFWFKIKSFFLTSFKEKYLIEIAKNVFVWGLVISFAAASVFLLCEPYALIDFKNFWSQIMAQNAMTKDAYVFPYTLQYVGTVSYIYFIKNMVLWGLGIVLGVVFLVGIVYYWLSLGRRLKEKGNYDTEAKELIIQSFFLIYFLVVGRFSVKFMRYLLPLYPIVAMIAAFFIIKIRQKLKNKKFFNVFLFVFLAAHLFWVFSFESIYSRKHSRVQASEWIIKNIPPGSLLAEEHWDDRLPLSHGDRYTILEMPMYEPDTSLEKWKKVENNLRQADYLILSSNRLYVPLQRLWDCSKYKKCYPKTAKYYQDLFAEKLGFVKIAEFTSYPGIFNDDAADESFTVYDHPKVIIFQKI